MEHSNIHCRGYLPHIETRRLQFITFRLYDSLPKHVIDEYKFYSSLLVGKDKQTEENVEKQRKILKLIDKYEDAGYGQCFLKHPRVAEIMQNNLLFHNGQKYELTDWCIMPNHVHVLINVLDGFSLSDIIHTWKSYTASAANKVLGRSGQFWMQEYFDRYIRDQDHYCRVVNYIANNPVKSGLAKSVEEWPWRGSKSSGFMVCGQSCLQM